ncbi:MAG: hypothetical protein FJ267_17305 [Planctomycetes bacterium]|nr:hypothetical protein [Planctomycetota bacterium]
MESTLHRQLKSLYGGASGEQEVRVDGYWIDAVADGRLIEIQRASLSAIRDKISTLLQSHSVTIVKPLAFRTFIVRRNRSGELPVSERYSPTKRSMFHLFEELVHFGNVFPHARLKLEVLLVEQEEHRIACPRRRFNGPDYKVEDRILRKVLETQSFQTAKDLLNLLPKGVPARFTTADVAGEAGIPRWLAQKMIYCLKRANSIERMGNAGNSIIYSKKRLRRWAA